MNLRKIPLTAFALLALTLVSCGAMRRLGKDALITVASPAVVLYGGFTDAMTMGNEAKQGLGGGALTEFFAGAVSLPYYLAKHTVLVGIHAFDILLFPAYGAADLHPYGPDIQPLDFYDGTPLAAAFGQKAKAAVKTTFDKNVRQGKQLAGIENN